MFKVFLIVLAFSGGADGAKTFDIQELKTMDECTSLQHEVSEMYTYHNIGIFANETYTHGFHSKCVKIED